MHLSRPVTDTQAGGDFHVGLPFRRQLQRLPFARGQEVMGIRRASLCLLLVDSDGTLGNLGTEITLPGRGVAHRLDGAGLIAWQVRDDESGYQGLALPTHARVTELDDTLYRIASVINRLTGPGGRPPEPVKPEKRAVDVERLAPDEPSA